MLMYEYRSKERQSNCAIYVDWEDNIKSVEVAACDREYDPSGYKVVYHKKSKIDGRDVRKSHYCVGASHLRSRLKKIEDAGYAAPMTRRAINMINKERISRFKVG